MSLSDARATGPRVLFVYFTYTQQSLKVAEAMAEVLRERGCDVQSAAIELTDSRYAERFTRFPLRHAYLDIFGMMPAQLRGATGEIRIPQEATDGDYDLVVIGSPTWWIKTSVPIRSYLKSDAAGRILNSTRFTAFVVCRRYWGFNLRAVKKLGSERGGEYVDGIHFSFAPTNLQPNYREQARAFANGLADRVVGDRQSV
jgi:menaquinone-dependent protoporphyrinogen IX oxidase